ncbi:hypothetical protein B0F86_07390, partial [Pseudomonas syringae]
HFHRADAVVGSCFGQHWQYAVVERIVGHEEGERHAHQRGDHRAGEHAVHLLHVQRCVLLRRTASAVRSSCPLRHQPGGN